MAKQTVNIGSAANDGTGTPLRDAFGIINDNFSAGRVIRIASATSASAAGADYVCDGTADDVQINAAIAAIATTGGRVELLEGTFNLAARLYSATQIKNLLLVGYGAKLVASASLASYMIRFHPSQAHEAIHIHGLELDGNSLAVGGIGFCSVGGTIKDCHIHGLLNGNGIDLDSSGANVPTRILVANNFLDGDSRTTMKYGILFVGGATGTYINAIGNRIRNVEYNGIAVYSGAQRWIVSGNHVTGCGHSCIAASPSSYGIIANNFVADTTFTSEAGIEIEYNSTHTASVASHDITVTGNTVVNCYWGIVTHNRQDDASYHPYNIVIDGNVISECTNKGLYLYAGQKITLGANQLNNPSGTDFVAEAGVDYAGTVIRTQGTPNYTNIMGSNVGIDTLTPSGKFHVVDATGTPFWLERNAAGASLGAITMRQQNTTDGNALLWTYLSDTTGVGASTDVSFVALAMGAAVHDQATRQGFFSILLALGGTGFVERARFDANGNFLLGLTAAGSSSKQVFALKNGTAPTTSPADAAQVYSADQAAGNACVHTRTENGAVLKLYQETTGIAASTFTANSGTAVNDASTFGGYTIGQVVAALRNQGFLQ